MALQMRNANQIGENPTKAIGRAKREITTTKHVALGEIGNQPQALRRNKPLALKDVKAKVISHRVAPLKPRDKKVTLSQTNLLGATIVPILPQARNPKVEVEVKNEPVEVNAIQKVDEGDDNPLLLQIYAEDIYKYLMKLENEFEIRSEYLLGQAITKRMRAVLVDWLTEVHQQFHMLPETLYLTVAIIDRFLQDYRSIDRKHLQLVGVAAMSVACKYEEMFPPEIGDFVYISDNTYTKREILQMEGLILSVLKFSFGRPLPLHFLRRYSKVAQSNPLTHTLSKYFLELSLVEYRFAHIAPSLTAAAAIYLAWWVLHKQDRSVWTESLHHYSTYSLNDVMPVVKLLAEIVVQSENAAQQAVRKKYTSKKYLQVCSLPELGKLMESNP